MKAIYIEEPGKVVFREIPKPVRKPGEALLKVLYGGICGSDLGSYRGTFAYLIIPASRDMNFRLKSWKSMRTNGGFTRAWL